LDKALPYILHKHEVDDVGEDVGEGWHLRELSEDLHHLQVRGRLLSLAALLQLVLNRLEHLDEGRVEAIELLVLQGAALRR